MHTKEDVKAIRRVGRVKRGEATTIAQVELDELCKTAEVGIDAVEALAMWYKLRQDGYTSLHGYEINQIEDALKRAGKI